MKQWVLGYIVCPGCQECLTMHPFEQNDSGEIISGILICQNKNCRLWYPIVRGIPRLLSALLRQDVTNEFIKLYHKKIDSLGVWLKENQENPDKFFKLKKHTIQNFGFEWVQFNRFGWDDPTFNHEYEKKIFLRKTLLAPEDFQDKVVLDAGCGNGRYTYWAAQNKANVIGIDLGDAVESAAKNTEKFQNVQIIQADLHCLPLKDCSLDIIFSIGVLMHTGDASNAAVELCRKLKHEGSCTIHVYGKGNFLYEWIDTKLRDRTTQMSLDELQRFSLKMYKWRKILEKIHLIELINLFVRIDNHPVIIFDWYAAPIATHHTYKEAKGWFLQQGFEIVKTNEGRLWLGPKIITKNKVLLFLIKCVKYIVLPLENTPVTVRAIKKSS